MIVNRYVGAVKTAPGEFEKMKISSPLLAAEMLRQAEAETASLQQEQRNSQDNAR